MESSELQIGDFVFAQGYLEKQFSSKDKVMKVTALDPECIRGYSTDDHGVVEYRSYMPQFIKPIPLTEDFLERNFPEYEEGYEIGWWKEEHDEDGYQIEFSDSSHEIVISRVRYVHEVQHIVRMCGLRKDIEA